MMITGKVSVIPLLLSGLTISAGHADTAAYIYDNLNRLEKAEYGGMAYIEYFYDDAGNMTRKSVSETPLLVELAGFSAEMSDGCVVLSWRTLSEIDSAGFHILRSGSENGEYERITGMMIAAEGEATRGASYSYTDRNVIPGMTYYYRLEDTDFSGTVSVGGAVSPVRTADVIRILQINAGISLFPPDDVMTDGKAGIGDAVRILQEIYGVRKR